MAPLAATLSEDVAFVITIAASGLTPAERVAVRQPASTRARGYEPEILERAAALRLQMRFDPPQVFAAVRVPILAFYGELDPLTPVRAERRGLAAGGDVVVVPDGPARPGPPGRNPRAALRAHAGRVAQLKNVSSCEYGGTHMQRMRSSLVPSFSSVCQAPGGMRTASPGRTLRVSPSTSSEPAPFVTK